MITKEEFIDVLKFIKEMRDKQTNFCSVIETLSSSDSYCDIFIYDRYEEQLYKLLSNMFNDELDELGYFLFESNALDNGFKCSPVIRTEEDGTERVLYDSAETLYDFLISEMYKQ